MEKSSNLNLNDKLKIDISESGLEVSNSIEAFNTNLNKIDKFLNSKNDINANITTSNQMNNIKTNSDYDIINDSSSLAIDNNLYNFKPNNANLNKKIIDPSSDILCQRLQKKIDSLNYDNYTLNRKYEDLLSQNKDLKLNLKSFNQNKETEIQIANEQINNIQNKLDKKEEELVRLKGKIKQNEKEINELEKNKKKFFEIQSDNNILINNQKKLNETIKNLNKNLDEYKNKYNVIISDYEIIKKDKEFMNRENFKLKENKKELSKENENLKNEIIELKNDKEKLMKKIQNYDMIHKKEYDELINRTKEQLNEKQKEEIEKIRDGQNNIMNLKIRELEEQNDDLKEKIRELNDNQKNNIVNNNELVYEESKKKISLLNDEVSYLKLQLQLKDSENKRLNRIYTENIDLIKELNNENNSYKEKLKLLNDKLNEVTTNDYDEINDVKEKLVILNAKNQSYEEQDNVFDNIFSEALLDEDKNNDEESKNMINTIKELPKGNNKRISQFRFLANKLKKLSKENTILNATLQNLKLENNKYKEESNLYQNIAQNSNEPYEYLLKELEKKDSELVYYKEVVSDREIRYKQVMKENELLKKKYNEIEKDLKQILENRDKINKLDYLVGKIYENQKKIFGGENFIQNDNMLLTKNTYKVTKNDSSKRGKKKNK